MKKFGEIGRFKEDGFCYVIKTVKFPYKQIDVPWFDIYITTKSSKKRNFTYKLDNKYKLTNEFNIKIVRKIESLIKSYLDEIKPELLAISAYEDAYNKRIKFYISRLKNCGYELIEIDKKINYPMIVSYLKKV